MKMLNEHHHQIEHLTDRFAEDALDVVWLPAIAKDKGIVVISADPSITSSKKEREVWREIGLTSFFFGGAFASKQAWIQIREVVTWWPRIIETAKSATKGTGYLLPFKSGQQPQVLYSPARPK